MKQYLATRKALIRLRVCHFKNSPELAQIDLTFFILLSIEFCVGPIKDTINDFWRMIWQLHIGKIVMLTNLEEDNKVFILSIQYIHVY